MCTIVEPIIGLLGCAISVQNLEGHSSANIIRRARTFAGNLEVAEIELVLRALGDVDERRGEGTIVVARRRGVGIVVADNDYAPCLQRV